MFAKGFLFLWEDDGESEIDVHVFQCRMSTRIQKKKLVDQLGAAPHIL